MANKTWLNYQLNWVTSDPSPFRPNTPASGVLSGTMSGTDVIYTQIIDVRTVDNCGLELSWTGTPTGVIEVLGSSSGVNFYPLTFDPAITQPSAGAGGYLINLNQFPWPYLIIRYTNSSGSGSLSAHISAKGLQ